MNLIYFLSDYNFERGNLLKVGKKNCKIEIDFLQADCTFGKRVVTIPNEKTAKPDESVCVVWETWRGRNGRGGYRIERALHPALHGMAKNVSRQSGGPGRVTEKAFGIV